MACRLRRAISRGKISRRCGFLRRRQHPRTARQCHLWASLRAGCGMGRAAYPNWRTAMIKLDNILVATDFSEPSDSALTYARTLARNFKAKLHVLHVTRSAFMFNGPEGIGVDFAAEQARIDTAAMSKLKAAVRDDDRRELEAEVFVRSGSPAHEIVDYANEASIDLIVIGTHGRGA